MDHKATCIFLACLTATLLFGCAPTLKDYQPRTSVEAQIKEVLMRYENAYNAQNSAAFLALFHEDAQIMAERKGDFLTKEEYGRVLPDKLKNSPKMTLGIPYIFVLKSGDKAVVETVIKLSDLDYQAKISLIMENGEWKITKIRYY